VVRTTFGPKREEVTGEWRKLRNEKHHIFYSSPRDRIKENEISAAHSTNREIWKAYGF